MHELRIDPPQSRLGAVMCRSANQLADWPRRTMFSRVLVTMACFHHRLQLAAHPTARWRLSWWERRKGAHVKKKNGLRTLLVGFKSSFMFLLLLIDPADVAAGIVFGVGGSRCHASFCIFTHPSSLLLLFFLWSNSVTCCWKALKRSRWNVWVNAAARRIWTDAGGQHARTGGRIYNASKSHFFTFWYLTSI